MLSKGRIESILMGLSFTVLNAKTESTNNNESEGDANCWTEVAHAEQRVSAANQPKNPPSPPPSPPPPTDQRLPLAARRQQFPLCARVYAGRTLQACPVLQLLLLVRERGDGQEHPGHLWPEETAMR